MQYNMDVDVNKPDFYYPILNIIREESKRYEYRPNTDQHIVVIDEDGHEYTPVRDKILFIKSW